MINFNHLYYFYRVGSIGSVSSAAKELRISQPALSAQLKTFEQQLGIKLLNKSGRSLALTNEGESILRISQRMFDISEEISAIRAPLGASAKELNLRIGITPDIERFFVLKWLNSVLQGNIFEHPPKIKLTTEIDKSIFDKLFCGELDIAISSSIEQASNEFRYLQNRLEITAICSKRAYYLRNFQDLKTKTELINFLHSSRIKWCLPERGSQLRKSIDFFFDSIGYTPHITVESDVLSVLLRGVSLGMGMAIVPSCYLHGDHHQIEIHRLQKSVKLWRQDMWFIASSKNISLKPKINSLMREFKNILEPDAR